MRIGFAMEKKQAIANLETGDRHRSIVEETPKLTAPARVLKLT
jgi:hypothetical protein